MLRSMFSAISALGRHQTYMDTVATNLANVNTNGYKKSRVDFETQSSQLEEVGAAPTTDLGGINALQVGLGTGLAGITQVNTQGTLKATGRSTDLAIQGDGYIVLDNGASADQYTRDGALNLDSSGNLVHLASGKIVKGWLAATNATTGVWEIDTTAALSNVQATLSSSIAQETANLSLVGNLNSSSLTTNTVDTQVAVFDSQGNQHNVTVRFTRTGNTALTWTPSITGTYASPPFAATPMLSGTTTLTFNAGGQLVTPANTGTDILTLNVTLNNSATTPMTVDMDVTNMTMLAQTSNVEQSSQDGLAAGTLSSIIVDQAGIVSGSYTNGLTRSIGQVALAKFANPEGLLSIGQNVFDSWLNSGDAQVGTAGSTGLGTIASGHLEASNVDLSQEFTNMILAQRGFQANSRVITTSDEMIQELLNMKR